MLLEKKESNRDIKLREYEIVIGRNELNPHVVWSKDEINIAELEVP